MRKRVGGAVALTIVGLVLLAAPALAHVTVDPGEAVKGSFVKLSFRVPNEVEVANTVKFEVNFDTNNPIPLVSVEPKAGWTFLVATAPLGAPLETVHGQVTKAVSEITWSGGVIAPGQFDEFEVLVGPLPGGVDRLLFPAVQTYSDGTEVRWDQQAFAEQPAPEHPMPELELTRAGGKEDATKSTGGTSTLALAAFLIGAAGLGVGGYALVIVRRWR